MFETMFFTGGPAVKRARKAAALLLSLTLHAAAVAGLVVMPLLRAEARLPGHAIINASLIAPPAIPVVPPGRSAGSAVGPAGPVTGPDNPPPARGPRRFLAPIEIPTMISDEGVFDRPADGPVGPGVPDSPGEETEGPWDYGKSIPPDEIKPADHPTWTVQPPRLIKRVNPVYPSVPLAARISGTVVITAITDIYGRVREAKVESGHPLLSPAALEAVREWIYEPHLVNGIPRPVSFKVTVTFTLVKR